MRSASSVPRPEVHHLTTIFRRLESGDIRVPAFQRSFSWGEGQVLELLDSVYRGFPIGSILLWEAKSEVFRAQHSEDLPFPEPGNRYPALFVLDGLQRLATLYGVFHHEGDAPHLFNVAFDLRTEAFKHVDPADVCESDIPVRALFSVKALLAEQKRLLALPDSEALLEGSVRLQTTFQEYLLPTVTISQDDVVQVVEVFRRINSTGTPLGPVDFMRALTWSDDFDLNSGLASLGEAASERAFALSDETLLKVISIVAGRAPISDELLSLRTEPAASLQWIVSKSIDVLGRAIELLRERCFVSSSNLLPYEGQLLAVVKYFATSKEISEVNTMELVAWFWTISFNEQLRGKPDHYVARQLRDIEALATGASHALERRLSVTDADFVERRLIAGKALSSAFVCMFAARGARSLVTGEEIPLGEILDRSVTECFVPVFSASAVAALRGRAVPSSRVFSNLVLLRPGEKAELDRRGWRELLDGLAKNVGEEAAFLEVLASQFIPVEMVHAMANLGTAREDSALIQRSRELLGFASFLTTR